MAAVLRRGLPGRLYYGWWIVAVFFLAEFVTAGAGTFTFSLYLRPMSDELNWSVTEVVAALSVRTALSSLVVQPIVGRLIDRYGPRLIVASGAVVAGGALISLGSLHHLWHWYLAYGIAGPFGFGVMGSLIGQTVVAKWFVRKRGRATAIVSFGIGFGGFVMSPVTGAIIHTMGWRTSWVVFGLMMWLLVLPASLLVLRRTPEDIGLLPDGDVLLPGELDSRGATATREVSWTVSEAVRTRTLWFMVLSFALNGMALSPILTHQAVYLGDLNFSPVVITGTVTMFAFMSGTAQLFWGWLADRFPIRPLIVVSFLISAVGVITLLALTRYPTMPMLILYLGVYGSTRAVAALTGLAYANYWGRGFLGSIRGTVAPFNVFHQMGGPLLAAFIYDTTGQYLLAFSLSLVLFLMAAAMMAFASPPRKREPAMVTAE